MVPAPVRPKKRGSFVWKITLRQTVRTIGLFFWVDLLIAVLFWGCVWLGVEQTAADMVARGDISAASNSYFSVTSQYGEPDGFILPGSMVRQLDLLPGSRYFSGYAGTGQDLPDWSYTITTPIQGGSVALITFFPGIFWVGFANCFAVLLGFEVLCLLSGFFRISGSVRKTLRPISRLTLATHQTMTAQQAPLRSPELQLGSTIDTLNAITENRLDTRIDVENEREELRGLAMAINSMLDRVDFAYRSQLRFVSDASHELRTPIAVIQGYANLLDRWGKEDQKTLEESISAIKQEADSMKELVEQLLFLARSDNNSITLKLETVDLAELVSEVARESQMIDQGHRISCVQREPILIRGDAQLLKQGLRILTDNAIKYTPEDGKVILDAREQDGKGVLSVTDSGIGIGAEDLPHLFDRFYRSDASRTRQTGGSGLGLSIAKWIVDSHGGVMEVVSREELGTRMLIRLPLAPEAAAQYQIVPL